MPSKARPKAESGLRNCVESKKKDKKKAPTKTDQNQTRHDQFCTLISLANLKKSVMFWKKFIKNWMIEFWKRKQRSMPFFLRIFWSKFINQLIKNFLLTVNLPRKFLKICCKKSYYSFKVTDKQAHEIFAYEIRHQIGYEIGYEIGCEKKKKNGIKSWMFVRW